MKVKKAKTELQMRTEKSLMIISKKSILSLQKITKWSLIKENQSES